MYSVVLLMALSGNADAAAFGNKGCNGCNGCYGCDGGCFGCDGCNGCKGGKMFGGMKLFGGKGCNGCNGCDGGCFGCDGGCNGCKGGGLFSKWKNKGCNGCNGGCHGCDGGCHGYNGCNGCNGGHIHNGCNGCDGGHIHNGCNGGHVHGGHAAVTPSAQPAAATIVVSLPAEARLTIDDNATTSTSERRVFVSPTLDAGQEYYYTLKAELNGQTKTERVTVRAGEEVKVNIAFVPAVASK